MWYQIVGNTDVLDQLFASLVPGIVSGVPNMFLQYRNPDHANSLNAGLIEGVGANQHANVNSDPANIGIESPIHQCAIEAFLPLTQNDVFPQDLSVYYLQWLVEYMVSSISKIHWKEQRELQHLKSFEFLFLMFKKIYLPNIFPHLSDKYFLYNPMAELPTLRSKPEIEQLFFDMTRFSHRDTLLHCQSVVLRWLAKYMRNEVNDKVMRRESIEDVYHSKLQYPSQMSISSLEYSLSTASAELRDR